MRRSIFPALVFTLVTTFTANAQHQTLRREIARIAGAAHAQVGVAINLLEGNDTLSYHNNYHYVLHSVAKFAIAMDMLHEIDKGRFKLDQLIHITKDDLPVNYSPLRDKYPDGNVDVSIRDLLSYMVSLSDNDACDMVIRQLGGTKHTNDFVHQLGVKQLVIKATEAEMAAAWPVQYSNWCQPSAQIKLLSMLYHQSLLSKASNSYLWQIMLATSTGPKRIKGLLPAATQVAHKTGTSATNKAGLTPACNDAGIIILPNGKHLAISVFITNSSDAIATSELIIAQIAKAAYHEFGH